MPFQGTNRMEERIALFRAYESGAFSVSELCRRFGISRETFYVWKARRESGEAGWFEERSHAVSCCPHATDPAVGERLVAVRKRFPQYGPKKIRAWLDRREPELRLPSVSTIADILKRAGLVESRRRVRRSLDGGRVVTDAVAPNDEWAMDFKGWFRTGDGRRCDPLTVTDQATRYLLDARIVEPTRVQVQARLERLFREVGLPLALRSDNGPPFGAPNGGGLSRLSVWLLKLGVEPRHIEPGCPQDNGRHERMHETLKEDARWSRRATRRNSSGVSTRSCFASTRSGRTRRWGSDRRRTSGDPRRGRCPRRCRSPGTTRTTRCGAFVPTARSSGRTNTCSSARCWRASRSGCWSSRTTRAWCGFAGGTWG